MKRKIISLILCLSLVLSAFSLQIAYASDYTLIYKIENGTATITGLSDPSYSGDIVIPETVEGYSVTKIAKNAFSDCSQLSAVTIPSTVTNIDQYAFNGCSNLTATYYLGSIADWCQKIYIDTLAGGNSMLNKTLLIDGQPIVDLIIPDTITKIRAHAFESISTLKTVTIPSTVTNIDQYAFNGCSNLTATYYLGSIADWCQKIYIDTLAGGNSMLNKTLLIDGQPIVDLIIPDTITKIRAHAFESVSTLETVTIPSTVTNIDQYAFNGCSNLTATYYLGSIADWCQKIYIDTLAGGNSILSNTLYINGQSINKAKALIIPEGTTKIRSYAFGGNFAATEITVPISLKTVDDYAFSGLKNLTDVYYYGTVSQYGEIYVSNLAGGNSYFINATKHFGYTITWICDEQTYAVTNGIPSEAITLPEEPQKAGYTFEGWQNIPEVMPSENITIEGSFKANTYIATLIVDNQTYDEIPYTYGQESIDLPAVPSKSGYSGSWSEYSLGINGTTITAIYVPNSHTITWMIDGNKYKETTEAYNNVIQLPDEPAKDGYTFGGWQNVPETMPDENITINGSFSANTYYARVFVDGELFSEIPYTYGQKSVDLPNVPKKTGYTGSWSSYNLGVGGTTINAIYTPNTYTVTFIADGKIVDTVSFVYGSTSISEPRVPEKEGHFGKWETYTLGAQSINVNAVYNKKQYIAAWIVNGKKTNTIVDYGAEIVLPEDPVYENHTFTGWTPSVPSTMPAKNLEFTATFKLTNNATVNIINYDKYNGSTQAYKTTMTFKADVKYGSDLNWHVDGASYRIENGACTVLEAENDFSVYCTVVDGDGNIVKSKTETIKIKNSFFDKLLAFFIGLFGAFKKIEQ